MDHPELVGAVEMRHGEYAYPDGARILLSNAGDGSWFAMQPNGESIRAMNPSFGKAAVQFATPKRAAEALEGIGYGPASVKAIEVGNWQDGPPTKSGIVELIADGGMMVAKEGILIPCAWDGANAHPAHPFLACPCEIEKHRYILPPIG